MRHLQSLLLLAAALPLAVRAGETPLEKPSCWSGGDPAVCVAEADLAIAAGKYRFAAASLGLACTGSLPDACAGLAALYATGLGVPKDDGRATAVARSGCRRGSQSACTNLATLLALGRGSPAAGESPGALREAACNAGITLACSAQGLPPPPIPDPEVPGGIVLDAAGARPGGWAKERVPVRDARIDALGAIAVSGYRAVDLSSVPRDLWPALVGNPRAFVEQPSSIEDFQIARVAGRAWASELGRCAASLTAGAPLIAWASFVADAQGQPTDVRAVGLDLPGSAEACLKAAVEALDPRGLATAGARHLVQVPITSGAILPGGTDPAEGDPAPIPKCEGCKGATMNDRKCVVSTVIQPEGLVWPEGRIEFKFIVTTEGKVTRFHPLAPASAAVTAVVRHAVEGCAWTPATDGSGQPFALWVVMPLRFR